MRKNTWLPNNQPLRDQGNDKGNLDSFISKIGCAAPFSQMLIAWGKVSSCCYQDRIALGDLRSERLRDIWNGKNFRTLRKKLLDGMPLGDIDTTWDLEIERGQSVCQYCSGFDNNAEWRPNRFRSTAMFNSRYNHAHLPSDEILSHLPGYIEFKYTMQCNLECPMCYDWWKPNPKRFIAPGLATPEIAPLYNDLFWEDLRPFLEVVDTVSFLGGEPLLQPEVWRTLKLLSDLNLDSEVRIVTNLSIWNKKFEQRLGQFNNVSITASLESCVPKLYEFYRFPTKFETFARNLKAVNEWRLKRHSENKAITSLTAILTVVAETIDTLVDSIVWLRKHGVQSVHIDIAEHPRYRLANNFWEDQTPPENVAQYIAISPGTLTNDEREYLVTTALSQLEAVESQIVSDPFGNRIRAIDQGTQLRLLSVLTRIAAMDRSAD